MSFHGRFIAASIVFAAVALPLSAGAQPDLSRRIGSTVADVESPHYVFDDLRLTSVDGERRYRIRIARPRKPPPPSGYPVVYLVDGNAVLMELDAPLLARLATASQPPLLVLIGYDNDLRIDSQARSYDYTPARNGAGGAGYDPLAPERRNGGADAFLELIERRIKPAVAARVAVDQQRQTLWGHSYGGLLVLHALFTQPQSFQAYVSVEPSLWWGEDFILDEALRFAARAHDVPAGTRLRLWIGRRSVDTNGGSDAGNAARTPRLQAERSRLPPDAVHGLARQLALLDGVQVAYREWPGLGHGEMLGAAVAPALEEAAEGLPDPGQ